MSQPTSPETKPRNSRRRRVILAAIAALAAVILHGSDRKPALPAAGLRPTSPIRSPSQAPSRADKKLRVATWNIHGGKGMDGRTDLDRIAGLLAGYDLIALNEVLNPLPGMGENQVHYLGQKLKMPPLFFPSERRWWRDCFGNGVLTSGDVIEWKTVPMPGTLGKGFRIYTLLRIRLENTDVHALVTHVDRRKDRKAQCDTVLKQFLQLPEPCLLLGDLNTVPGDPAVQRLLCDRRVIDVLSLYAPHPYNDRVDWILARGFRACQGGMISSEASDHPLFWAELEPLEMTIVSKASSN